MGIFNFFKPKKNESEIIKKLFPNLKGIHFESISTTPKGDSPEKFFNSDIDGRWFFSVHNFAMIFKSFSNENYEKNLLNLLESNGIDKSSIKEESNHFYFQGNGFKIEKPKSPGINLIIISNENITHTEVVKLKSFDSLNEVKVEWINGIDKIYDGEDALKRFDLTNDLKNVAMYFKESDGDYLLIHIPTSNIAESIINQIIDKNREEDEFVKENDEGEWQNLHENKNIVIGYLPKYRALRINNKQYRNDRIETSSDKVHINDLNNKDGVEYYNGKKYTGIVEYDGGRRSTSEFKEGKRINIKDLFDDGTIRSFEKVINGKLFMIESWTKIDSDGNYDENGRKLLLTEFKDGRVIEYYKNGNIKRKLDVNQRKSTTDDKNTYSEIKFYENGNLDTKIVRFKYDEIGELGEIIEFVSYYETGELKEEKVEDSKYVNKWISYHRGGSIESIDVSDYLFSGTYQSGLKFEFDESGNEVTKRFEEEIKSEENIRKHLNLGEFNGIIKVKSKERKILSHEVMTKGVFSFNLKSGDYIEVFGQRQILVCSTEHWNAEDEEWFEYDRDDVEEFHLTGYEEGYKFDEDDLIELFEIEENDYPEWDHNGLSYGGCGMDDEDDYNTRLKKWNTYKNKFPKISSKSQFKIY